MKKDRCIEILLLKSENESLKRELEEEKRDSLCYYAVLFLIGLVLGFVIAIF